MKDMSEQYDRFPYFLRNLLLLPALTLAASVAWVVTIVLAWRKGHWSNKLSPQARWTALSLLALGAVVVIVKMVLVVCAYHNKRDSRCEWKTVAPFALLFSSGLLLLANLVFTALLLTPIAWIVRKKPPRTPMEDASLGTFFTMFVLFVISTMFFFLFGH